MTAQFVVEQAGCTSCAARIRDALGELGEVEAIDVDGAADVAFVRLVARHDVSSEAVDAMLQLASQESGHAYRIRPGSFART